MGGPGGGGGSGGCRGGGWVRGRWVWWVRVDVNEELKFLQKFKKKKWGGVGGGGVGWGG